MTDEECRHNIDRLLKELDRLADAEPFDFVRFSVTNSEIAKQFSLLGSNRRYRHRTYIFKIIFWILLLVAVVLLSVC